MENSGGSRPSDKVGVGEGRGHSRLRDKGGGAGLQKTFFFGHSVFSVKINGGGGGGAFLAPPPGSATGEMWTLSMNKTNSFSFIRRYFTVLARVAVY